MQLSGTHIYVYSTVITILALQSFYSNCEALKLSCDSDNILEVMEGVSNNSAICSGLDQKNIVQWWIDTGNFGFCNAPTNGQDTCTVKVEPTVFVLSRKEVTESVVMINTTNTSKIDLIENKTLQCEFLQQSSSCSLDLIFPAEGKCLAKFIRRDSVPWDVSTDCNITKVYSSLGRYYCEIYSVLLNTETRIFTDKSPALISAGGKYKSFSCKFTDSMPTDAGLYNYKAIITPGRKIITATSIDSLEILLPTKSAVRCSPSPYVPENTNVTCTCNTSNIGKPSGRLKWYRGNNQTGTCEYGDSTLVMSQTIYRSDSGVTQFRCDVDWTSVTSGDSFTISVGYVDQSVIKVNNSLNLTVAENQPVTFNCSADGRPTPTMSLINKGNGILIRQDTSPLTHTLPSARCEDTSTYSCLASNGMGKDTTSAANLYVNCKPKVTPKFDISTVNYMDKAEKQVFTVIAYPSPDNFTFIYLGSEVNIAKVPTDIYLNVTCSPTQLVYNITCTLIVDDVSPSAVGLYKVIIGNKYGSVNFTIKVNISGPIPTESSVVEINAAAIVGGIVAGVLVIAVIIVIVIVIVKRRNKGTKDSGRSCFKDKSPLQKRQKDDSDLEYRKKAIDDSKINHAFSPEPQQTESPKTSAATTAKQGINKEIDSPTAGNSATHQARVVSNLPLLMQPPVLQSRSKPKLRKSDENKRKKGKKFEGTKDDGEYENVSLPIQATAGDAKRKTHQNKNKGNESHTNAEGIMYMELDFSQSKNNKTVQPKPAEVHVEYAPIDFSKHTS